MEQETNIHPSTPQPTVHLSRIHAIPAHVLGYEIYIR